jgi:hypothetical protein
MKYHYCWPNLDKTFCGKIITSGWCYKSFDNLVPDCEACCSLAKSMNITKPNIVLDLSKLRVSYHRIGMNRRAFTP